MPWPSSRSTIKRMMMGVAVAALLASVGRYARLSSKYSEQAKFHKSMAWSLMQAYPGPAGRFPQIEYHTGLQEKYERAARYPWLSVAADLPEPPPTERTRLRTTMHWGTVSSIEGEEILGLFLGIPPNLGVGSELVVLHGEGPRKSRWIVTATRLGRFLAVAAGGDEGAMLPKPYDDVFFPRSDSAGPAVVETSP